VCSNSRCTRVLQKNRANRIYNIYYERRYFGLVYVTKGWIVQQWPRTVGEAKNPVASQSKKLETSDCGGPKMQPQFKAEGLGAPWR
jgi:hypothetical protein